MILDHREKVIMFSISLIVIGIVLGFVILKAVLSSTKGVEPEPAPAVVVTGETPHPWMNTAYWKNVVENKDSIYEIHCAHGIPILYNRASGRGVVMSGWDGSAKQHIASYALEACGDLYGEKWRENWKAKKDVEVN